MEQASSSKKFWGLGFRVQGSGFRDRLTILGYARIQGPVGFGIRVSDLKHLFFFRA